MKKIYRFHNTISANKSDPGCLQFPSAVQYQAAISLTDGLGREVNLASPRKDHFACPFQY